MKKVFFLYFFCLFYLFQARANEPVAMRGDIISSEELSLSGQLQIQCKVYFLAEVQMQVTRTTVENYQLQMDTNVEGNIFHEGDSALFTFTLTYNPQQLAFYPISFEIEQELKNLSENNQVERFLISGMVYFTPYNTIEVWNLNDFHNLPRKWYHPASNILTERKYVAKDSIPISNLSLADTVNEEWKENWTLIQIEGLAYAIPMKAMHPDTIAALSAKVGDGKGGTRKRGIFQGTIKGRLITQILNDYGLPVDVPLKGIRVELAEFDHWAGIDFYETFSTGYTDDNGDFELPYFQWQNFEGNDVELYLQVKSKTKDGVPATYKIKAKQNNIWKNIYWDLLFVGNQPHNAGTVTLGNLVFNQDQYRTVSWTRNAMEFVIENNVFNDNMDELALLVYRTNLPASGMFTPFDPPTTIWDPTIRYNHDGGIQENTSYHEFGHFFLWGIQNKHTIIMEGENGNCSQHSAITENTSSISWLEGFAEGFRNIIDAHFWQDDNEYAARGFNINPKKEYISYVLDYDLINHGFLAEELFAGSFYDLWDGSDKGLPNFIPWVNSSQYSYHGYNDLSNDPDAKSWNTVDNISYSFSQLMLPFFNHQAPFLITNISQYYYYFLDEVIGDDCEERAKVSRLLNENHLQWDINNFDNTTHNSCIAADDIYFNVTHSYAASFCPLTAPVQPSLVSLRVHYYPQTVNETYNVSFPTQGRPRYPYIINDLWLGTIPDVNSIPPQNETSCTFSINGDATVNTLPNGQMETCAGADIELNNATFVLGNSGGLTAELRIKEGSIFKISPHGKLQIHDNSRLVIEQGATLLYEQGAEIVLLGNNAILEIRGNLSIGDNAIFTFTGSGFVRLGLPSNSTGNNFGVGANSELKFVGQSPTDKVLEIMDWTYLSHYGLAKTTVQNGKCELGQGVFWDTGNGAVLFENATFTAINPTQPYRTIYVNGQNPIIHKASFSYALAGLTARNAWNLGAILTLEDVEIHHCQVGLQSYDKSCYLFRCNLHDNQTGWKQEYATLNGAWDNSEASYNSWFGVDYEGNTDLYMKNPNIYRNQNGVIFKGGGTLSGNCGSVKDNTNWGITLTNNGSLDLAGNGNYGPKLDISNNSVGICLLYGDYLYLKEGRNNLSPNTQANSLGLSIAGVLNSPLSPLKFNHNHWNEINPFGVMPNAGSIPMQGTDYNLFTLTGSVYIADGTPIHYESCFYEPNPSGRMAYIAACEVCTNIETASFANTRLDEALRQVATDFYGENSNIGTTCNKLYEIINNEYASISPEEQEILDAAWRMMKSAFAKGIVAEEIAVNSTGELGLLPSLVLNALEKRILQNPTAHFSLSMDKVRFYQQMNRPEMALTVLSSLQTENEREVEMKNHWACYLEICRDKKANMNIIELQTRLAQCPALSVPVWDENNQNKQQQLSITERNFVLYPNPAKEELYVVMNFDQETKANIKVYDVSGKKVLDLPEKVLAKGTTSFAIPLQSFATGLYNVVIYTDNQTFMRKLVVE